MENHFLQLNERESINASEFEILTASAFQLFNDAKIEVGVVEVGMGGRLDATNILNNQAVSVISKIARDHQNFLGNTIEEIALHKAGILRPKVPYLVNPINEWYVHDVINGYAKEIGAGPLIEGDTAELRRDLYASVYWHKFAGELEAFRRDNAVLAYLAVVETLKSMHLSTVKVREMLPGIKNKVFPGRFQTVRLKAVFGGPHPKEILVDGAHNTDAALALAEHVMHKHRDERNKFGKPNRKGDGRRVTWVIAMTDGKDAYDYLTALLQAGDTVVTTSFGPVDGMPWVKPMDPKELFKIARRACPDIIGYPMPDNGAFRALCAAKYLTSDDDPIVVTGSLYLVGDLLREKAKWDQNEHFIDMKSIDKEERSRVNTFLSRKLEELDGATWGSATDNPHSTTEQNEKDTLKREIEKLDEELSRLEQEENNMEEVRLLELQRDIATTSFSATPDSNSSKLKQKFFTEFEAIRKKLQELPGLPSVPENYLAPVPDNDLRDKVRNVQVRPNPTNSIVPGSPRFRIRPHLARGDREEKPITGRDIRITPSPDLPTHIRRIVWQGQAEVKPRLVDSNAGPRVSAHYSSLDGNSLDEDKTDRRGGKRFEQQPRKDTQTIRTSADPKMKVDHDDDDQSGSVIRKHMAYQSKQWIRDEKRLVTRGKSESEDEK
jgi:folylpolyglutamate synthase/dihydrofolate synthase